MPLFSEQFTFNKLINVVRYAPRTAKQYTYPGTLPTYELMYYQSGDATVYFQGRHYHMTAGCILYLPKGIPDNAYSVSVKEDFTLYNLYFDSDYALPNEPIFITSAATNIGALYEKLFHIWIGKRNGYYLSAMQQAYAIAESVYRSQTTYTPRSKLMKIAKSEEYLAEHYNDLHFDYTALAAASGLSYSYFKKLFIERYGCSPVKRVQTLKVYRACELLQTGQFRVSDVAKLCGFENAYYFSTVFKKQTGLSPKHYQTEWRTGNKDYIRYPLLLRPVLKSYLWGGQRLKTDFRFQTDATNVAEGWLLACHRDGTNIVENGVYAGESLQDVLSHWGYTEPLPVLIKLIDAADKLSVQVHPDDEYANKHENDNGKTEMWYVVDCEENAELIYGFKHELTQEEFRERIVTNTLDAALHHVPVQKGDVFYIEAGTLHAIGAGILIAEVQQNSNTTYRVSDYGRLDANGQPRELHIEKAIEVTNTVPSTIPFGAIGETETTSYGTKRPLATSRYFQTELFTLNGNMQLKPNGKWLSAILLSGSVQAVSSFESITLQKGDSLFLPEGCELSLTGIGEILVTT